MNKDIVRILNVVLDKRIFPDDEEFQTIFGYDRLEYNDLLRSVQSYANKDSIDGDRLEMMESAIAQIVGYPHGRNDLVESSIGFSINASDAYERLSRMIAS
jgi:hypothetical protein